MITAYKQKMKEKLYKGKPLNNHTISKGLNYFSAFLKWAEEEMHVAPLQPLRIRRLPYTRPVPTVLSINQAMAFIDAAEKPYNTMFKIFFYLGLRNRGVRRLQWSDMDWEKCAITASEKGGKVKWHPLPEDLTADLRQMYIQSQSPWIFPSPRNSRQPINKLYTIMQ